MGIRFRCPNGHKIHVKGFLAGKRGICPECGIKVPIPRESAAEFAGIPGEHPVPVSDAKPAHEASESAVPVLRRQETPSPRPGRAVKGSSGSPLPPSPAGVPQPENRPASPAAEAGHVDPFAEAPQAKWYVLPPSGGQFGPASGSVLQEWIGEGRVTADSYVWREGWPEWRRAEVVLGEFRSAASDVSASKPIPSIVTQAAPKSTAELYRRRKSSKMTITIVGLLALACAILFTALVYVVRFMN